VTWYGDDDIQYGEEVRFTEDVEVTDVEFLRVRCFTANDDRRPVYTNFHALARLKPDVERRCDEETLSRNSGTASDDVLNVLMVGIDSTSRLNSIRRLSSTRNFMLRQLHVSRVSAICCPS